MKGLKQINNEIKKNAKRIEELTNEVCELSNRDEIRTEARANNYARCKELHEEAEKNAEQIKSISEEIYILKIIGAILQENRRAAIINEALPIIAAACEPYNGKAYGEKTREKIRDQVRAAGFTFYFDGYGTRDRLEVAALNANGCCYGSDYCTIYTNYETPFVDSFNKLQFDASTLRNRYKYAENPRKAAKAIIKAHETFRKATAKAYAAQSAINELLPESIDRFRNVTEPYRTIV